MGAPPNPLPPPPAAHRRAAAAPPPPPASPPRSPPTGRGFPFHSPPPRTPCPSASLRVHSASVSIRPLTPTVHAHVPDEASARDPGLRRELHRELRLLSQLRGDRAVLRLLIPRDGARTPEQSGEKGIPAEELQQEPLPRAGPRGRYPGGRSPPPGDRRCGPTDRGDRRAGDGLRPARHASLGQQLRPPRPG